MSFFDDFGIGRSARAKRIIAELNLAPYVAKAVELFGLKSDDIVQAMLEYRHLLYLMYWSKRLEESTVVVPTELADKLWHAHILSTRDYIAMCDKVSGSYLHHQPGMQKGTVEHTVAMKRTRELHHHIRRAGKTPGFDENYFAELDPKPVPRAAPKARSRSRDTSSDGGVHGTAIDPFLPAHTGDTTPIGNNDHSSSFGGGSSGGGGASGGWGDSSSSNSSDSGSDSSSSDSGGGGGCGGGGD